MDEGYCCVCFKLFCCKKCRMKHENIKHRLVVLEDCQICQTGRMCFNVTKKYHNKILSHIREQHLELYCRKCKKVFKNISELMEASKCEEKKENCFDKNSVVISGNMPAINQMILNNNSDVEIPRMKYTSTPTSGSNNMEIISPDELLLNNRDSNNCTPTDLTPIYNVNSINMPVVTPLRSIISKSKTNNTDRRVTFSDLILTGENESQSKTNHSAFITPENNRSCSRAVNIVAFDLSPASPSYSQSISEMFYTPEGPSNASLKLNSNKKAKDVSEEVKHIGLMGIFENISKTISTVIRSVFKPEQVEPQLFYMNTSGSIKRFLSPTADRSVPKLKRLCVRGRQPITRTNSMQNENSK